MSTVTSNSQALSLSAGTAQSASWPQWFDTIVVTNLTADPAWLTTDGTLVTSGEAGADVVAPGQTATFANRGLRPDVTTGTWPGTTEVSVISAASGPVVIAPQ